MKTYFDIFKLNCFVKCVIVILIFCSFTSITAAQQKGDTIGHLRIFEKNAVLEKFNPNHLSTTDTLDCLFLQTIRRHKAFLSWKRGFIVINDSRLLIREKFFPLDQAPFITGPFRNQFLTPDKKRVLNNQIVKVILL